MDSSLNTRSMIFTIYGDYIRHYGGEIWIGSLIRLFKEFGHNEQSVRAAISRMHKQNWVQSRKEGNRSYYFLTEQGIERMQEAAERIFKLRPNHWDGKWRMLIYTIPEEKRHIRDELRKELVWSGFGTMANSVWISPNDLTKQVYKMIDKYDVRPYIHYFITEYNGPHERGQLIKDCWNIDEINEKYEAFIEKYKREADSNYKKIHTGQMTPADCFVERTKLVHEYRKFLFIDPGLPEELLPEVWLGNQASALFRDYYKVLAKPASSFFEEVFQEGNVIHKKDKAYDVLHHPFMADND
ncbi:phenylacetic acid degradation operon negative regulatory protein PaaX [Bacillus kwashiorkori]|uniref:phenylacetic acid degradation operon negative regulatory protein PaaX n=1 Tax=Bacillus kwashiorkori TaxID=1522318 RepID=UPI00078398CC|nr:phenylacetic acid degradation operon negative regulatory protein PaaX [Bacillus kwashiorkori]